MAADSRLRAALLAVGAVAILVALGWGIGTDPVDRAATPAETDDVAFPPSTGRILHQYRPGSKRLTFPYASSNVSGVAWDAERRTYVLVSNGDGLVYEVDSLGNGEKGDLSSPLRAWKVVPTATGLDIEGISSIRAGLFWLAEERNRLIEVEISADRDTIESRLQRAVEFPPPAILNKGLEGVAVAATAEGHFLVAVQESQPMRVFAIRLPTSLPASYRDSPPESLELFLADTVIGDRASDLAGIEYDERTNNLLILSQESNKILEIGRIGAEWSVLNELAIDGMSQAEGLTLGAHINGHPEILVVGEPNEARNFVMPVHRLGRTAAVPATTGSG